MIKLIVVIAIGSVLGCSHLQEKHVVRVGINVEDGISEYKAEKMVFKHLSQLKFDRYEGEAITVSRCTAEDHRYVEAHPELKKSLGDFAFCHYSIQHSSDPYCSGVATVIESCTNKNENSCVYKVSDYSLVCE